MNNPGWVDLQVNGYNGVDFSDPALSEEDFLRAADGVFRSGTALFLPTIVTSAPEVYSRNPALMRRAAEKHGLLDRIPGVHLEGPFISPKPGAVGAHNPQWVQTATAPAVERLFQQGEGFIRMMTFGADAPGVANAIRQACELGIAVSVGHHLADAAEIRAAADAGARTLTHLGNGIPNSIDRHRNPIWAGLAEDRLTAMIITDGHHLPAEVVKVICRCKGAEKIIVTSDASPAAGFKPGRYHVLGNDAILEPGGRLYNPEKQCLVGSASILAQCMAFLESLEIFSEAELLQVGRTNALALLEAAAANAAARH